MSEAVETTSTSKQPVAPQTMGEAAPESFNIFSEETSEPVAQEAQQVEESAEEPVSEKRKEFLDKVKYDRQKRAHEIELKKKEIELRNAQSQAEKAAQNQELLRSNPNKYLKEQGIDPLNFQRMLAESALEGAIQDSDSVKIEKTQMELAKLKTQLAEKEKQETLRAEKQKQQAAINKFVSNVDNFRSSNAESYPLVTESLSAQEIAQGMGEHYRDTGEQLTLEQAFSKLETALKKNETEFYNDPAVIEKFKRYNPGLASQQVKGPQATLSSSWKEQPTRTTVEDMSYEQIREMYKGKLFS